MTKPKYESQKLASNDQILITTVLILILFLLATLVYIFWTKQEYIPEEFRPNTKPFVKNFRNLVERIN
jgi:flagellar basal body-associated protein FliL